MVTDILENAWHVITDMPNDWLVKILASGLFLLLARHMAAFTLFAIVVTIDLFSKFLALSHKMEVDEGRENLSIVDAIRGIPEAHRRGIINSYAMKTQFCTKILVYMLVVGGAGIVDALLIPCGGRSEFVLLAISYLAATELLSIVENLDDAGVSAVHGLVTLIKRKRGV